MKRNLAPSTATLQFLYGWLDITAIYTNELSLDSLGPWDTETVSLSGAHGDMSFGVRHRNGVGVPRTEGTGPATSLADNRALGGNASCNGELVGFTPHRNMDRGKSEISVALATQTGITEFTELQSWDGSEGPGSFETGDQ